MKDTYRDILTRKPELIKPLVLFIGYVYLIRILGHRNLLGLLMKYRIQNWMWKDLFTDVWKLYHEGIPKEHEELLVELCSDTDQINFLKDITPK